MARRELASNVGRLLDAHAELNRRVASKRLWGSVADQARFVIRPYLLKVSTAEKRAAQELLEAVEGYAA